MGLGNRIFGPNRLLTSNAVVDVEKGTAAPAGGTTYTWAAIASGVDVLLSGVGGGRDFASGTAAERTRYLVSGVDPSLNRPDVRLKVVRCPDLPDLEGRYLAVLSSNHHPAGRGGLIRGRVNLDCSVLELPGDSGGA